MERAEYYNRLLLWIVIGGGLTLNVLGGLIAYLWF